MVFPKWVELYKNKSLSGDSGTETFAIKRTDEIIQLLLKFRAKNGATRNAATAAAQASIEAALTKIEVKSGSASFKNYSAEIARKIATYRNGCLPDTMYTQAVGGTYAGNNDPTKGWHEIVIPIDFCTKLDPLGNKTNVIMPAPLYDSLDIAIDYNFPISATAGFITGGANHVFDLYALVLPKEDPGVMQNKRILTETKKQDYTSVASGDQPFPLTLDNDRFLRQLMCFCYYPGIIEGVNITDLKFKVNNDIVWATKWGDLQSKNALDCGLNWTMQMFLQAGTTTDEIWTRVPAAMPTLMPKTDVTAPVKYAQTGDKITITTNAGDDIANLTLDSNVIPAFTVMDFDRDGLLQNMPWCGANDLELILTNGGASSAVQIIEQHIAKPWGHS